MLAKITPKFSSLFIFLPFSFLVQKALRVFLRGFPLCRKKSWAKPAFNWKHLGGPQEQAGQALKVLGRSWSWFPRAHSHTQLISTVHGQEKNPPG